MNRVLAETLSVLNGVFALVLIVAGGVIGVHLGPLYAPLLIPQEVLGNETHAERLGVVCGLAVGFLLAVTLCGLFALFIQMHRELKTIRNLLKDATLLDRFASRSRILMPEMSPEARETPRSSPSRAELG
jgi:hypothetical protein